jgi:putative DNA primase/helicase
MLAAARSEPDLLVPSGADLFDAHPHLLNCRNGTVDLRTGEHREHRREDFLTRLCPTRYVPRAPRDGYVRFLHAVFAHREDLVGYVRRHSGYAATGETDDHSFLLLVGGGSNGKGVLTAVWSAALGGEYAVTAPPDLLAAGGGSRHPTELTVLRGARLAVCSETDEGAALDEARLKRLASDDPVTARGMKKDFFTFRPTHKIIVATNHLPRMRGTDHGLWRRVRVVPFDVRFWKDADRLADPGGAFDPALRADPGLAAKLAADEAEGVLADMVEHAVAYYRGGRELAPPAGVVAATAAYRREQDVTARFLADRVRPDPKGRVPANLLYRAFVDWCAGERIPPGATPGPRAFGQVVRDRYPPVKASSVCYPVRLVGPGGTDAAADSSQALAAAGRGTGRVPARRRRPGV